MPAGMASSMNTLLDATSSEGQQFTETFFKELDSRGIPQSITPTTSIVWNGQPLVGQASFAEICASLPITKHDISGFDVQPFPLGDTNILNMMVNASGSVQFGPDKCNTFAFSTQQVVRRPSLEAPLMLHTMAYRLVHKRTDSTFAT